MRNNNMIDNNSLFNELLQAVRASDAKYIVTLIEQGVDIEEDRNRALMLACQLGNIQVVKILIGANANVGQNNNEALLIAVVNRHAAVTAILLAEGADHTARDGAIWEEATRPQGRTDGLTALTELDDDSLSDMDWVNLLDKALSQRNQLLAEVLVQALPKEEGAIAVVVALEHGNTSMAKQLLDCGVDFEQHDENSALAFYSAWTQGSKSLLPQLYACGATTSGALNDYIYRSNVSTNELDADFLSEMLKISEYDHLTCELIAQLTIPKYLDTAAEAISHLSAHPVALKSIFTLALSNDAKALYQQLMELKAGISVSDDEMDWLEQLMISCSDRELISYLLGQFGGERLQGCSELLDSAIDESDVSWAEHLICFGLRPSQAYNDNQEVTNQIENINGNTTYLFSVYLHAAERGGTWAALTVAGMYEAGNGTSKNRQQAIYWYTQAAESGHLAARLELALILVNGEGIDRDQKQAIY